MQDLGSTPAPVARNLRHWKASASHATVLRIPRSSCGNTMLWSLLDTTSPRSRRRQACKWCTLRWRGKGKHSKKKNQSIQIPLRIFIPYRTYHKVDFAPFYCLKLIGRRNVKRLKNYYADILLCITIHYRIAHSWFCWLYCIVQGVASAGGTYLVADMHKNDPDKLQEICAKDALCIGVTSDGHMKRSILPSDKWTASSSGLYVFGKKLEQGFKGNLVHLIWDC